MGSSFARACRPSLSILASIGSLETARVKHSRASSRLRSSVLKETSKAANASNKLQTTACGMTGGRRRTAPQRNDESLLRGRECGFDRRSTLFTFQHLHPFTATLGRPMCWIIVRSRNGNGAGWESVSSLPRLACKNASRWFGPCSPGLNIPH